MAEADGRSSSKVNPLRQLARIRRVVLMRIPGILVGRVFQARLVLRALRNSVVGNTTLQTLTPDTLALRVCAVHVAVCPHGAVACRRPSQRVVAVREGVRDAAGADVHARSIGAVEVGGDGRLLGKREVGFALLDDLCLVLVLRVDDGLMERSSVSVCRGESGVLRFQHTCIVAASESLGMLPSGCLADSRDSNLRTSSCVAWKVCSVPDIFALVCGCLRLNCCCISQCVTESSRMLQRSTYLESWISVEFCERMKLCRTIGT